RGCRVTGVELNPVVAQEAATRLRRVIVGDVLQVEIPGQYDAIVATELFEHLRYPEQFLARMKSLLRPGGRIVLSVPNVGHYSVVEDLLAGRWDYLPIGLLCYTHFRFFTRSTLEDWIARADFSSWEIIPQTTELPERLPELSNALEIDTESLKTKGFYVILKI
ncbi:MAG: class I SAM-dependent methyltransferase, partial [bacterium]|nr:class I SAM-dependent methyltransferase [bacterium]